MEKEFTMSFPFSSIRHRMLLCAAVLSVLAAVPVFGEARSEFHQTFKLDSGSPVSVKNTNGNITITAWDNDYVDVYAELRSRRGEDELELVEISVTRNGSLRVETILSRRQDDSFLSRLFGSIGRWPDVTVEYTLKVPRNVVIEEAATVNGGVKLRDTDGMTSARSTNGTVNVENHRGVLDARTTNGNIEVKSTARLREARTVNGSIDVTIVSGWNEPVSIETVNGSVDLSIPAGINADLSIRTVNGGIQANGMTMTLDKISKHELAGSLGSGGPQISVKTVNGGVELRQR
jgi:hypothetical protein